MNYLIAVFLTTDVWIFTYRFLLQFLNQIFPAQPDPSFLVSGAIPEPFETLLYILLIFFVSMSIYFILQRRVLTSLRQIDFGYWPLVKRVCLVLLVILFLKQLGDFPLNREVSQYSFITPFISRLSLVVAIGYLFWVLASIGILAKVYPYLKKKNKTFIVHLLVILFIAFLTFEPGFPIYYLDYSQLFGPILEVASGKIIYTQTSSQYGFLSILILSFLTKLGFFNITYLPFLIWWLYILQYYLCFYLIFRISKSIMLASISLLGIITLNYFSLPQSPISVPIAGPFRWLQIILLILLFYKLKNLYSRKFLLIAAFLSLISIDMGILMIGGYILTLFFLVLKKQATWKKAATAIFYLFVFLIVLFSFVNLGFLLSGHSFIAINNLFLKINQYSRGGFAMLPIPPLTYFWFVVLFYFASLVFLFRKVVLDFFDQVLLLTANLSIFASVYYVGRSHPYSLLSISIFPLLNFLILVAIHYKKIHSGVFKLALWVLMILFLIAIPAFNRRLSLSYIIYEKINRLGIRPYEEKLPSYLVYHFCKPERIHLFDTEIEDCLRQKYEKDVEFIKKRISDEEIVILSPDETYLFYLTGKKNMLQVNPQASIYTKEDLDFALQKATWRCPRKIIVDPRVLGAKMEEVETLNFLYTIQPNLFEGLQEACKFQYVKSECTKNLCLVEVQQDLIQYRIK